MPARPLRRKDGSPLRDDKAKGLRFESSRDRRDRGKSEGGETLVLDLADHGPDIYRTFPHQGKGGDGRQFPPRVPRGDIGARRMEGANGDRRKTPPDLPATFAQAPELPERKIRRGAMGWGPQETVARCHGTRQGRREHRCPTGRDIASPGKTFGKTPGQRAQGAFYILQTNMQGKEEPVHVPFYRKCPTRQQCVGKGDTQHKGETENIGTVQDRKGGKELCNDQVRYRYHHQKRHGGLGSSCPYR